MKSVILNTATPLLEDLKTDKFWDDIRAHQKQYNTDRSYRIDYNVDWAKRHDVEMTPDGKMILYHATRSASDIRKSGVFYRGSHFSPLANDAKAAAKQFSINRRGKLEVMKVKVDPASVTCGVHVTSDVEMPVEEV